MPRLFLARSIALLVLVAGPAATALADAPPAPSVAVFALDPKNGFTKDVAELLTDVVVQSLRDTKAFSRVVAAKELESVVSLNLQKELLGCAENSCIAEIAGQLGVDFLVSGSIGRLGRAAVLNIKLLNTKTAMAAASVSQAVCGEGDEALLSTAKFSVRRLVHEAGFAAASSVGAARGSGECDAAPAVAAAPASAPAQDAADSSPGRGRVVAGGVGMGVGAVGLLAGLAVVAGGAAVAGAAFLLQLTPLWGGSGFQGRLASYGVVGAGMGAVGLVGGTVALVVGFIGILLLTAGLAAG